MFIEIDPACSQAIYEQVVQQVERKSIFESRFQQLFDEAIRSRLEPPEIREMVEHILNTTLKTEESQWEGSRS